MNGTDHQQPQSRRSESPPADDRLETPAPPVSQAPADAPASSEARRARPVTAKVSSDHRDAGDGPRFWALPDKNLTWWILREDDAGGAAGLTDGIPTIFVPELSTECKATVGERCRDFIRGRLRDRWHEDLFQLIKRLMVGGIFTLGGLVALRFIEYFDVPLLLCALGYSAYAAIRYGGRFLRSMEAANRPFSTFVGEPFVISPLAERIAGALEFRRSLPPEKRGEAPDSELLDANAYRKLIREGVVSRDELCALGQAVQARLDVSLSSPKKISDVSRAEGLDSDSAAMYRDLALAAAEIAFDAEFK